MNPLTIGFLAGALMGGPNRNYREENYWYIPVLCYVALVMVIVSIAGGGATVLWLLI